MHAQWVRTNKSCKTAANKNKCCHEIFEKCVNVRVWVTATARFSSTLFLLICNFLPKPLSPYIRISEYSSLRETSFSWNLFPLKFLTPAYRLSYCRNLLKPKSPYAGFSRNSTLLICSKNQNMSTNAY